MVKSVESKKLSSISKWNLGWDRELFVSCWNDNCDNIGKVIKYYLDLLTNNMPYAEIGASL